MANYTIQRSEVGLDVTVNEASKNTTNNVALVGQNFTGYGDEIATNFLQMLENFASTGVEPKDNSRVPGAALSHLPGQLWYDLTGTGTLKVWGGSWAELAKINTGTTLDSTLRWNNTAGRYEPEELVRISDAGVLSIWNGTDNVSLSHDGVDFNIIGVSGTADINVTSGITAVNLPEITLTTALDEIYGGTGKASYVVGDLLFADTTTSLAALAFTSNGQVLTLAGGVPTWAAAASGVTDHGALTGNADDDHSQYVVKNGLFGAQTIDAAAGWTFNNAPSFADATSPFTVTGTTVVTNLNADMVDGVHGSALALDSGVVHNTGVEDIDGVKTFLTTVIMDVANNGSNTANVFGFKVSGRDTGLSDNEGYFSIYSSDENAQLVIGTAVGSNYMGINSVAGDLQIRAANTLMMTMTGTTASIFNSAGTAMAFRNPFTVGTNATTSATVGDINNNQYNVGYNETPYEAGVGQNINTGSFSLLPQSIGKMISRTTSTSRSITLDNDTDIPIGAQVLIHNGSSGGTLTVAIGTITNLDWIDGSGSLPTRTVNRTLAYNSIVTIRKVNSTTWQIWGNGIT